MQEHGKGQFGAVAGEGAVWCRSREEQGQCLVQEQGRRQCLVQEQRSAATVPGAVCGAGAGEGAGTLFGAGAGEGAGQVGGDESMVPPNYDPADGLSLSCDTPVLTLSRWRLLA